MRKLLLFVSLCLFANFAVAQKKAVKQAKSNISKTNEARELIKPALTDAETANDPETWFVAGNIEFKSYEDQYEAEITKELTKGAGWNQEVMYTGIYNMVDYYKKADELGQIPDSKGKVKNKFRKDIAKNFITVYPFYINGGVYYNDEAKKMSDSGQEEKAKELYKKATDFFELYWNIPTFEVLEGNTIEPNENTPVIKYYSVICAIQSQDDDRAVSLLKRLIAEDYVQNDTYGETDLYELLAEQYKKGNDSINYIETLKLGSNKFPSNRYFTPNLINEYLKAEKYDDAIAYLDQAVANDPSNTCDLMSVKASLLAERKSYEEAKTSYQNVLTVTPNCERALYGLGIVYIMEAEALQQVASQETNHARQKELDKEIANLYLASLPYLEKFKDLQDAKNKENNVYKDDADLKETKQVLIALNSAYYNLSFLQEDTQDKFLQTENEIEELKQLGY